MVDNKSMAMLGGAMVMASVLTEFGFFHSENHQADITRLILGANQLQIFRLSTYKLSEAESLAFLLAASRQFQWKSLYLRPFFSKSTLELKLIRTFLQLASRSPATMNIYNVSNNPTISEFKKFVAVALGGRIILHH